MICYSCSNEADLDAAPEAEQVYLGEFWRVAHAMRCPIRGWLILLPRRHTTSIAEHTAAEGAELGALLIAVSAAVEQYTGCAKTYVAQFAEAAGFAHTHFHVIPRPVDLATEFVGPGVFDFLTRPESEHLPVEVRNDIAREIRPLIAGYLR